MVIALDDAARRRLAGAGPATASPSRTVAADHATLWQTCCGNQPTELQALLLRPYSARGDC